MILSLTSKLVKKKPFAKIKSRTWNSLGYLREVMNQLERIGKSFSGNGLQGPILIIFTHVLKFSQRPLQLHLFVKFRILFKNRE